MPPVVVADSSYEFVPPHQGNLWPRILGRFATRLARTQHGVTEVEVRNSEQLSDLIRSGHGILLAPNHCRMADALVLQSLSKKVRQPFFVMASSHLFRGRRSLKWALRRMGAFSVYREGVDRQAVATAIAMLTSAQRPLVVFPEGALSHANDHLNALMEGVSFMARTAARKLSKSADETSPQRNVYVVPIAIRYLFQGDLEAAVFPILTDIERRLSWRPQTGLPLVERIYKLGNALLGLKETEFLGSPSSGSIPDRLQSLIDNILAPMEKEWGSEELNSSVINRVKALRKAIVPGMIQQPSDSESSEPLSQTELDRRWRQLEDMELAQALSLFPREYIASNPTVDRILETIERIAKNLSGSYRVNSPMKVVVQIGTPLKVAAKRDRTASSDPVMNHLETELTAMLETLSKESAVYSGGGNPANS